MKTDQELADALRAAIEKLNAAARTMTGVLAEPLKEMTDAAEACRQGGLRIGRWPTGTGATPTMGDLGHMTLRELAEVGLPLPYVSRVIMCEPSGQ
jgi:hypothetical protein